MIQSFETDVLIIGAGGHSYSRSIRPANVANGNLYTLLHNKVKKQNINILNNVKILELVTAGKRVTGAIGINSKQELIYLKSIILLVRL